MLILWRRFGERLMVGADVEIEVLEARANRVKLGIVAPASVSIVRKEVMLTREENVAAALSAGPGMIETLLGRWTPAPLARAKRSSTRQISDTASNGNKS